MLPHKILAYHHSLEEMLTNESEIIKDIKAEGYRDPFDKDCDDRAVLVQTIDGVEYRRFIVGLHKDLNYHDNLNKQARQVRKEALDKVYAQTDLDAIISQNKKTVNSRTGGLKHPSIVFSGPTSEVYTEASGHHRNWRQCFFKYSLDVIEVTEDFYNLDTGEKLDDPLVSTFRNITSMIQGNPGPTGKHYKIPDAVNHITQLLQNTTAKKFEGRNPTGMLPPRYREDKPGCTFDFDDMMNMIYADSGNFLDTGTRTKIRNLVEKRLRSPNSRIVSMKAESDQDHFLTRNGYTLGKNENGKRVVSSEFFDDNNGCLVVLCDDNGKAFAKKIETILLGIVSEDDTYRKFLKEHGIKEIHVMSWVHDPPSQKSDFSKRQDKHIKLICDWSNVFDALDKSKYNIRLTKCTMASQLKDFPDLKDKVTKF
tara:strand:- start:124 stop:1395 length:1272 start_codon:yes stop_codon:yes gene_type:complete